MIYGYPGSTFKNWIETLKTAHSLGIDAYQLYRLRIVPHGAKTGMIKNYVRSLSRSFRVGTGHLRDETIGHTDLLRNMDLTKDPEVFFASGPSIIPTTCKTIPTGFRMLLGIGISSWTNLQDRFYINTGKDLAEYYSYLNKGKLPITRGKIKTEDDRRRWPICLSLKHNGLSKSNLQKIDRFAFRTIFRKKNRILKKYGSVEDTENMLSLTERGRFFADEVVIQFYHPDYMPFPKSAYSDGELNPYNS